MTEDRAIEKLKNMRLYMELTDKESECKFAKEDYEANELAIRALEKQIPKKPKMRHIKKYDNYNDGWCPSCEAYVQELDFDTHYCQNCGQRLEWGDLSVTLH